MTRCLAILAFVGLAFAESPSPVAGARQSRVASLDSWDIADFEKFPSGVRSLLKICLSLTKQNLGYKFGSSDPADGGMDCSGTVYHVLQAAGITDAPRTASEQYVWVRKAGTFEAVISRKVASFELDALRPGDLLFWTVTYSTDQEPPVSHTMIYLGKRQSDGQTIMFGASDGRTYDGRKIYGVSVFDFRISKAEQKPETGEVAKSGSNFIGYARIPDLDGVDR
jgi:hypothetical protein